MKAGMYFAFLALLGLGGCATAFRAPSEVAHIKLERVDSTMVAIDKIWLERKDGELAVKGYVQRQLGATTIAFLRSTAASIQLTTAAIAQLRATDVTDRIINYLPLANPLQIVAESRVDAPRYRAPRSGSAYQPYRPRGFTALRFSGSTGPRSGHRGGGPRGGGHCAGHNHGGHR